MKFYIKVIRPMVNSMTGGTCLQDFNVSTNPWNKHRGFYLESEKEKFVKEWKETRENNLDTLFFDEKYIELEIIENNKKNIIVVTIDTKEIDSNQIYNISKMVQDSFPNYKILFKFKGIKVEKKKVNI